MPPLFLPYPWTWSMASIPPVLPKNSCCWIRARCSPLTKSNLQMLIEKKVVFNQNADSLGRWWTQCPPKTVSEDSVQPWREVISITETGSQSHHHPPLCAGSSTSCDLPLDVILFHSLVRQFVWNITEGKAREKIWSCVIYLFLNSTSLTYGKNWQVRQSIV